MLDGWGRTLVWLAAAALDLSAPTLLRRRLSGMRVNAAHLAERYGLLVLIALGETVVAIGAPVASAAHLDAAVLVAVAVAFALCCGLWWVYFHFATDAIRHGLATAAVQLHVTRHVLSYGHLSFIGSVIAIAVGLHDVVAHPSGHLSWAVLGLLYGGCAAYLATFGYTRWAMFHQVSTTRLTASGVVVLLLPVAHLLPGLAALALLTLALAGLNAAEFERVRRRQAAATA
ncbi:MAG TPA: low temperature requirement protein A [Kribbellaceae bacterium]